MTGVLIGVTEQFRPLRIGGMRSDLPQESARDGVGRQYDVVAGPEKVASLSKELFGGDFYHDVAFTSGQPRLCHFLGRQMDVPPVAPFSPRYQAPRHEADLRNRVPVSSPGDEVHYFGHFTQEDFVKSFLVAHAAVAMASQALVIVLAVDDLGDDTFICLEH